jgi:hypothetical protein
MELHWDIAAKLYRRRNSAIGYIFKYLNIHKTPVVNLFG